MSRLVCNPLTGEPVLVSPERGERPGAWGSVSRRPEGDASSCPFCPGNEEETPPELVRKSDGGRWRARVVPNKYPAIGPVAGVPSHEVLIDTDEHDSPLELREPEALEAMITLWRERWERHAARPGVESIVLFRNEGRGAGQSIDHPHSQLLALPFVHPRLCAEMSGFASAPGCPLCGPGTGEDDASLLVARHGTLQIVCPAAPRLPYECWIVPGRHAPDWTGCDPTELAGALRRAVRALRSRWPSSPFNLAISSAPLRAAEREAFHWHLEILPRVTGIAGFELATGAWMNIVDPARAAVELRALCD